MTPNEQYEARKAERAKWKDLDYQNRQMMEGAAIFDSLDRIATAFERIADAMEKPASA